MMTLDDALHLPDADKVVIYRDDRDPERFYLLQEAPRIARDADGRPQCSLLLYRREGTRFGGGQLSITVDMAIGQPRREAIAEQLREQFEIESPTLVTPEWSAGEVSLQLGDVLKMNGRPSLLGDNQAALMATLSPEQAQQLNQIWLDGLPETTITYRLDTTVAARHESSTEVEDATDSVTPQGSTDSTRRLSFTASEVRAVPFAVELCHAPDLTESELVSCLQVIDL